MCGTQQQIEIYKLVDIPFSLTDADGKATFYISRVVDGIVYYDYYNHYTDKITYGLTLYEYKFNVYIEKHINTIEYEYERDIFVFGELE